MPDGKRKRRHSSNVIRRQWYALHRSMRFGRRFGLVPAPVLATSLVAVAYSANGLQVCN